MSRHSFAKSGGELSAASVAPAIHSTGRLVCGSSGAAAWLKWKRLGSSIRRCDGQLLIMKRELQTSREESPADQDCGQIKSLSGHAAQN
jgi:hypothetical protein